MTSYAFQPAFIIWLFVTCQQESVWEAYLSPSAGRVQFGRKYTYFKEMWHWNNSGTTNKIVHLSVGSYMILCGLKYISLGFQMVLCQTCLLIDMETVMHYSFVSIKQGLKYPFCPIGDYKKNTKKNNVNKASK